MLNAFCINLRTKKKEDKSAIKRVARKDKHIDTRKYRGLTIIKVTDFTGTKTRQS